MGAYKVVFQISNEDKLVHKALIVQITNLLVSIPDVTIEIMVHGPGVNFVMTATSVKHPIQALQQNGVTFLVCKNSLNERNIDEQELIEHITIVQSAMAHLVVRQTEGWSYIKVGF